MASIGGKKLTQLRVTDLKTELEKRGLDKSGLKNALVERLEKSLLDESGWSDFMEQGDNLMSTAEGTQTQNGDVDELNTPLDDNIEQPSRSNEPIIDAESLNCKIDNFALEIQTNRLMIQKVAAKLADKFSTIQPRPDAEDRNSLLADLRKENQSLKDEKENLFARINNLEYMLANLQSKVKAANDEKSCLITTIRLLREDIVAEGKDNYPDSSNSQGKSAVSNSNEVDDCTTQSGDVVNPNIQLGNSFAVLSVQENNKGEEATTTAQGQDTLKENTLSKEQKRKKKSKKKQTAIVSDEPKTKEVDKPQPDGEQRQSKTSVVVAGDSIIKYVKGWELSNDEQIVSVKSFSGATVDDMGDFLKPSIRKRPDKLIIHAGTNDVRSSSPTTIAKKVTELAEQFKKESSNTRIIISSLVTRSDNQDLARKVNDTNNIIKSNCCKKNWVFLDNSNINRSHLNYRGLHLNHEGSALLQDNFKNILKSQD